MQYFTRIYTVSQGKTIFSVYVENIQCTMDHQKLVVSAGLGHIKTYNFKIQEIIKMDFTLNIHTLLVISKVMITYLITIELNMRSCTCFIPGSALLRIGNGKNNFYSSFKDR